MKNIPFVHTTPHCTTIHLLLLKAVTRDLRRKGTEVRFGKTRKRMLLK